MTSRPLRILTLADTAPDPNRGASGADLRVAQALRAQGHHVDSIWNDTLGRRIGHGNMHLLLELPHTYARSAARAMRRNGYDVVQLSQPHGFRAARLVHRIAPRSVFIHRSHGLELHVEEALRPWRARLGADARTWPRRLASRIVTGLVARHSYAIAREADGHIVSSSLDADFLRTRLGVASEKIAVIPQAPPDSYVALPAKPMTEQRMRQVLHVAQLAFIKAPTVTARAMGILAAGRDDLRFTWVCDVGDHDAVRALLDPVTLSRTRLLPWMPQEELRTVYDECGAFLFPSFFEGFGRTFLEAMSRGLCVVASDCGGMHDVIHSGRDGVLVPVGDANVLAASVQQIVAHAQGAAMMSAAAAATAREYTWERVARETALFYERRIGQRA
jgi:glycosyltransferase involved in cell wall biosynthesis